MSILLQLHPTLENEVLSLCKGAQASQYFHTHFLRHAGAPFFPTTHSGAGAKTERTMAVRARGKKGPCLRCQPLFGTSKGPAAPSKLLLSLRRLNSRHNHNSHDNVVAITWTTIY